MSQMDILEFGKFKKEVDFTDADFLDKVESANNRMQQRARNIQKTGKKTDIIRKNNEIIDKFFDEVFGQESSKKMFGTSQSTKKRVEVYDKMMNIATEQAAYTNEIANRFQVRK